MSEIQERIFTANDDDAGVRLDKFLSAQMPEYSRSEIQKFTVARTDGAAAKMSERGRRVPRGNSGAGRVMRRGRPRARFRIGYFIRR